MMYVFYTYLDETQHSILLKNNANNLPLAFQDRLSKFKRWQDQQASLLGRILLKKGVEQLYNCEFPDIILNKYGKPYFRESNIQFNVSHSHQLVVCAITKNKAIGIDIEHQKPIDIQDFKFQMTNQEWQWISTAKDFKTAFYEYWTKKEAVIKAIGKGFSANLKSFQIIEGTKQVVLEGQHWYLSKIAIAQNYLCHLATSQSSNTVVQKIEIQELLKKSLP